MRLANPLILLLGIGILYLLYRSIGTRNMSEGSLRFSNGELVSGIRRSIRVRISEKLVYFRALSLLFLIIAAARPQTVTEETKIYTEGIDIVLAVDVSSSMKAMDFEIKGRRVNRLEAVKDVVDGFIAKRPDDRIGMVAFSGQGYTICPLTLDHDWLEKNIERVKIGMIEDGTAIGSAITASLNRIKDTEAKSKVIILLTDGRNNAGRISPQVAAEAAKALGVRIYTIGAGTKGMAPFPVKDRFGNVVLRPVEIEIDEDLLIDIADVTGGRYFRATDTASLKDIYQEIDKLEKTSIEESGYNVYGEKFPVFLIPGLILLVVELTLNNTILRRIP